jgi:hypothetical protein
MGEGDFPLFVVLLKDEQEYRWSFPYIIRPFAVISREHYKLENERP